MDLLYVSGRNNFPHGIEIHDVIFIHTLIKRGAQGGCEFVCLVGCQDKVLGFCQFDSHVDHHGCAFSKGL